jgi:hypothetical protein
MLKESPGCVNDRESIQVLVGLRSLSATILLAVQRWQPLLF